MRKIALYIFFVLVSIHSYGQKYTIMPYDKERYLRIELWLAYQDSVFHTIVKPFVIWPEYDMLKQQPMLKRKLLNDDLINIDKGNMNIHGNFLWKLEKGNIEDDTNRYYRNTRGFEIYGSLGKKIFFYTRFLETQAVFRPYLNTYIDKYVVIPSESWWKPFGDNGRDYSYGDGFISFRPLKWLRFDMGHGKNFVGDGYRSLLLSDNSFSYPFAKITLTKGSLQYTMLFSELYNFNTRYYFYHYSKHATFNILSYSNKKLEVALFEGIIWQTSDYNTYVNKFSPMFFVPVIGLRPLIIGMDGNNNALLGISMHYSPVPICRVYAQAIVDNYVFSEKNDNFKNRTGWQIGIKSPDLFFNRLRFTHLSLFTEFNKVRPYTYTSDYRFQNYTHYNQALAHPAGSGFTELVGGFTLVLHRLELRYKYNKILQSQENDSLNLGTNLYDKPSERTYDNIKINQYAGSTLILNNIEVAGVINSKSRMQFYLGFDFRKELGFFVNKTGEKYFYFGFRTTIGNLYYDF